MLVFSTALLGCNLQPRERAHASASGEQAPSIPLTPPRDAELEARLTGILEQMKGLEGVRVKVRSGVVHLSGTAETASLEERAMETAARLDGVVYVRNEVSQPPSPWGPLAPTWRMLERLGRSVLDFMPELAAALIVLVPFVILWRVIRRWRRPFHALGTTPLKASLLRVALQALVLVSGILVVLDVLGIMGAVAAVVGTLGVLGIVAGFVFKDWVSIYLPGLLLGLNPPFKAGDLVELAGREGRVARVTPSVTVIVTPDGDEVRIPNAEIFRDTLVNFSEHRTRRLRFPLSLAPEADLGVAEEIGRRAMLDVRGIKKEPAPFMRVQVLAQQEVHVEFFAWVDQDEVNFRNAESRAKRAVIEALRERGVPLSAVTLVVHQSASRPQQTEEGKSAEASSTPGAGPSRGEEGESAELVDQAFLDREFEKARNNRTERDLLDEDARSESRPHA